LDGRTDRFVEVAGVAFAAGLDFAAVGTGVGGGVDFGAGVAFA